MGIIPQTSDRSGREYGGEDARTLPGARGLAKRGGIATLVALLVNGLLVWAFTASGIVRPFAPLAYSRVFRLTALGAIGATVTYAAIGRVSTRPDRTFAVVAGVVLLASFVPNVVVAPSMPGATTGANLLLAFLHVTVAAICYGVLTR